MTHVAVAKLVPLRNIPPDWSSDWADLALNASEPNPFAEDWFVRTAVRHLSSHESDSMAAVWLGHELLGMLPLTLARRYGRLPLRNMQNWVHYHCFDGSPLVRAGREHMFWGAILTTLDKQVAHANFLHMVGLNPNGPVVAALRHVRKADVVHRSVRAMLHSDLDAETYLSVHVRSKKRKEMRRLRSRLEELGPVAVVALQPSDAVDPWIEDFLSLEASGWKGRQGTALVSARSTRSFFSEAIGGAHRNGKLEMLRMTVNDKTIAMLVNFLTPPGSFAFKIAFDEEFARFSPGVLLKIENLKVLDRSDIDWMDSCAIEDHPMINSLWAERREIVRVTIPLAGARRRAVFQSARFIEKTAARLKAGL